ncbi:hypothetical protein HU200_042976 [Digitaria exilis]|uniref:BTB domain-containing protein n=1 Tax=Digitaria exilis TaxID=1010633 RepID=A0A835BBZ8_9POAL|nr:hypothetical protein HU200_042976 [Digitaria exilis]CAB3471116.1 unnamed protein product [Digitaria exilis]
MTPAAAHLQHWPSPITRTSVQTTKTKLHRRIQRRDDTVRKAKKQTPRANPHLTSCPSSNCAVPTYAIEMPCTQETINVVVHSSKQIKIQGFSLTSAMTDDDFFPSGRWKVGGHDWEYTLKVLRELPIKATLPADYLLPSSALPHHLGDLLQKGTGADVTFVVSGEFFRAHKAILASRSLVFMAEFFGHMKEKRSPVVEVKDMKPAVFGAMLHFIYTDSAPELHRADDGTAMAQHLLVAADRYGIDRLKLICEDKLYDGVCVDTAATTLALAEQHGCSYLKARCVEVIVVNLEAVMATEGYGHLMATCPQGFLPQPPAGTEMSSASRVARAPALPQHRASHACDERNISLQPSTARIRPHAEPKSTNRGESTWGIHVEEKQPEAVRTCELFKVLPRAPVRSTWIRKTIDGAPLTSTIDSWLSTTRNARSVSSKSRRTMTRRGSPELAVMGVLLQLLASVGNEGGSVLTIPLLPNSPPAQSSPQPERVQHQQQQQPIHGGVLLQPHRRRINGYSATRATVKTDSLPSRHLAVGGYDWEVHYTPSLVNDSSYWIAFRLVLLAAPCRDDVKASLKCRLVDDHSNTSGQHQRQQRVACASRDANAQLNAGECQLSHAFKRANESSGWLPLRRRNVLEASGCIKEDSFTVECTVTVITEQLPDTAAGRHAGSSQSSLGHDLGELLRNGTGSDVKLVVSGETFAAHKAILASRSPVFMAQLFGHMKETRSQRVEIKDMKARVFGAMLGFIYTDMVPELDRHDGIFLAVDLLAAADMYGIDRLKSICQDKACHDAGVETAAMFLALAEQHGCSKLKARCVELIAANLDAVMETEGYKHLMATSPLVLNDLLRAVKLTTTTKSRRESRAPVSSATRQLISPPVQSSPPLQRVETDSTSDSPRFCSSSPSMGASSSNLTDAACAVHLFKINGYSATRATAKTDSLPSKRLAVGGYDWEIHYTPSLVVNDGNHWIAFKLVLLAAPRRNDVKAALKCRLMDVPISSVHQQRNANGQLVVNAVEHHLSHAFKRADESSVWLPLRRRSVLEASGCITEDSFTVECTVTVIREQLPEPDTAHVLPQRHTGGLSQSSLRHDLGELLRKGTGSDVTLVVSGESFTAYKAILASRSPVFMAQLFGHMKETRSQRVEIKDMKAKVFRAMLGFIYTDMVPELDRLDDGIVVAVELLAAADMYGIDMLKSMCEDKICNDTTMETAAMFLALAEQHGCSKLKARCVELIAANLDAVMETEGYKHLMVSSPLVLNDLLRAVRGRKN